MRATTYARIGKLALMLGALVGVGGLVVLLVGLAPIAASSGHWAVTEWTLQFAKRRAIATQSLFLDVPSLGSRSLLLTGAGHYETGCRSCHGAPGYGRPVVLEHALPPPPRLERVVPRYGPRELHFVVMNGLKFTGMPAWPAAERPDEVWALVAFMRALPELDAREYRELVFGSEDSIGAEAPLVVRERCARCHGSGGFGRKGGAFPVLAGQKPEYLRQSLLAYSRGKRHSGIMQPIAQKLDEGDIESIAQWYASRRPPPADADRPREGERIALEGIPARKVPSCSKCHQPASHSTYPLLDGQPVPYLRRQMELFAGRRRGGTRFAHLMHDAALHALSEQEALAVARYYGVGQLDDEDL